MDESDILKNMAKVLGPEAESVLKELEAKEEKKRREQKLLEALNKLVSDNKEHEEVIKQEIEETIEAVNVELVQEDLQQLPQIPVRDVVTPGVVALSVAPQQDVQKVADAIPNALRKELDIIKKSVADFHRFAQRHSQLGGGGASSLLDIDRPSTLVTSNSYVGTRKDYYIGVNYDGPVTITLPVGNDGKEVIVKDESGIAKKNHITINASYGQTIDNNTTAIIGINNGSLKFLYRDGWRII